MILQQAVKQQKQRPPKLRNDILIAQLLAMSCSFSSQLGKI
jgi:hypothetical protein